MHATLKRSMPCPWQAAPRWLEHPVHYPNNLSSHWCGACRGWWPTSSKRTPALHHTTPQDRKRNLQKAAFERDPNKLRQIKLDDVKLLMKRESQCVERCGEVCVARG